MKICVWRTGHEIADTVGKAIYDSLKPIFPDTELCWTVSKEYLEAIADINIGYGILRNMDAVWKKSAADNKPYFIVDRGYWKPGHYDGYYRVSLNGTQQTTGLDKLKPDYDRLDALGIELLSSLRKNLPVLICPPTWDATKFFGLSEFPNIYEKEWFGRPRGQRFIMRTKGCERPLQQDLDNCSKVCTFNSSVGWEALRQGIPVISDPKHSIVGAFEKMVDRKIHEDIKERRRLFGIMASLQLTLEEMKAGKLYPLITKILEAHDGAN